MGRLVLALLLAIVAALVLWLSRSGVPDEPTPTTPSVADTAAPAGPPERAELPDSGPDRLEVESRARALTIHVFERPAGRPVAGVEVRVFPFPTPAAVRGDAAAAAQWRDARTVRATTTADGTAVLTVDTIRLEVMVDDDGWFGRAPVDADAARADVSVGRVHEIFVRAVDQSGTPLPRLPIDINSTHSGYGGIVTDEAGLARVRIPDDEQGPWMVQPSGWVGPNARSPVALTTPMRCERSSSTRSTAEASRREYPTEGRRPRRGRSVCSTGIVPTIEEVLVHWPWTTQPSD